MPKCINLALNLSLSCHLSLKVFENTLKTLSKCFIDLRGKSERGNRNWEHMCTKILFSIFVRKVLGKVLDTSPSVQSHTSTVLRHVAKVSTQWPIFLWQNHHTRNLWHSKSISSPTAQNPRQGKVGSSLYGVILQVLKVFSKTDLVCQLAIRYDIFATEIVPFA